VIFRSFTAKDLDHVLRLVVLAFLLAGCAASIDLSLVAIAGGHSDVKVWDNRQANQAISSWIFW